MLSDSAELSSEGEVHEASRVKQEDVPPLDRSHLHLNPQSVPTHHVSQFFFAFSGYQTQAAAPYPRPALQQLQSTHLLV
jgi:hypothetical protein